MLKRRTNHLMIVWISLKARHLNASRTSSSEPCKYVFSYILVDRIICSSCLSVLNI